jgi:hypothetical protein
MLPRYPCCASLARASRPDVSRFSTSARSDGAFLTVIGRLVVIPARRHGRPGTRVWIGVCPHCHREHQHGLGLATDPIRPYLGSRSPDCADLRRRPDYKIALPANELGRWAG